MSSGNPQKAAEDEAVRQVRAGIREGKSATITLTPSTRITIAGSDEDEAEFITRIIVANIKAGSSDDDFVSFLHAFELYTTLYAINAGRRPKILKALKRTTATVGKLRD